MSVQQPKMNVQWNNHLQSLGTEFPRMLTTQRFVDVTLACEGRRIHCHRVVLAACSSYFEDLLEENPAQHPIIILPKNVKYWMIQALVDFMYRGEVNVSEESFNELIECAELLQIHPLKTAADNFNGNPDEELEPRSTEEYSEDYVQKTKKSSKPKSIKKRRMTVAAFNEATESPAVDYPAEASEFSPKTMDSDTEYTVEKTPYTAKPPKDFKFNKPANPYNTYTRKMMWSAMMCVKAGESVPRAADIYKVPHKTLYAYVKRHGIKLTFRKIGNPRNRKFRKNLQSVKMEKS
ncbi:hypothetical protein DMENIID0001_135990 [Sergentomyia squamirostris]